MSDYKDKSARDPQGVSTADIKKSTDRIEGDLYFGPVSVQVRLGRIEERLNHVATKSFILSVVLSGLGGFSAVIFTILRYLDQ